MTVQASRQASSEWVLDAQLHHTVLPENMRAAVCGR